MVKVGIIGSTGYAGNELVGCCLDTRMSGLYGMAREAI